MVRDRLAERVADASRGRSSERAELADLATASGSSDMLAKPADHKWLRISSADVGQPGCGHWHSRPRLGLLGMLMGWWRVKVSSGCPLWKCDTRRREGPRRRGVRSPLPS